MPFAGFTDADFATFAMEDFATRMASIRGTVRPKLIALGEELTPHLQAILGPDVYPHVASHMRRRVNPPPETWVAFGRSKRAYKAFAHFGVGVRLDGAFVQFCIKDESTDKPVIGAHLKESSEEFARILQQDPHLHLLGLPGHDEEPVYADRLTDVNVAALGDDLLHRRTAWFTADRLIPRDDPTARDPQRLIDFAAHFVDALSPLYRAACES